MTSFLVNVDHIATLRNARREQFPDPVHAAAICESAGADGIVFHLREDRRHITERDVRLLKETVQGRLDFEMSTSDEIVRICCDVMPDVATLVPERREEVTTEGGLDVFASEHRLLEVIPDLVRAGIPEISLFIDPDSEQIERSAHVGATCVEFHTGDFANAPSREAQIAEAHRLARAARIAHELDLKVHAGHGLNYHNYPIFGSHVPFVEEVSIGFAIIARAVMTGLHNAVEDMNRLVKARYEQSGS
ncbi:MAG: pyridoxine 5'-phosphate synthase [Rhodothermales bacterium]|nr:pyridoxine 5'-phosphate synthase [Rhodothermales bacterium]